MTLMTLVVLNLSALFADDKKKTFFIPHCPVHIRIMEVQKRCVQNRLSNEFE